MRNSPKDWNRDTIDDADWNSQADVIFVLDSSDTVGSDNFAKMLQFVQNMVTHWTIGPTRMQVGVVTYGGGYHSQIPLNKFRSANQLTSSIASIPFSGGTANRGTAFQFVSQSAFGIPGGGRPNVPHVVIHVSNGRSSNPDFAMTQAKHLKDQGVSIFNVGVGGGTGSRELTGEASNPGSRYVIRADNYNALNDLSSSLASRIKNGCPGRADIVFLLDSSTSVGKSNYEHLEDFLKHIVSRLPVGRDLVHVGMMQFSSYPSQEFPLDMYKDRVSVLKAIDGLQYMGGGTNTADALKYMREQMFSQNAGARSQVPRIAVVITDGQSSNTVLTTQEADRARLDNIEIIAVGVGAGANRNELHSIASDPDSTNMFIVGAFSDLKTLTSQILYSACNVHSTAAPLTTMAPGATHLPDVCADKLDNCATFGKNVCTEYKPWADDNCKRFCGICHPLHTDPPPPCVDKKTDCDKYGSDMCTTFGPWAHDNCMKFCGFCDPNKSSTGYYGQCYYGGKAYSHGEKWEDGCDYQCICEDGKTGRYRCFNKCPVYYDLPNDCTLVHSPGECCLKPVCNFKQHLEITEGSGEGKTPTGISVCLYSNKQYYQDQSWEVDCDYKCRCIDAQHGTYQCQAYCPTYTNLPVNCRLQKNPGKCCAEPHCEFNQQTGSFIGRGSTSGIGSVQHPTAAPACENVLPNCEQYGKSSCIGPYVGWAKGNCRKYCDYCVSGNPTPSPTDSCYFGGKTYHQGDKWSSGCDTQCVCENAIYGYYRCTNTCPVYNNLPLGCKAEKKAGDCCEHVTCPNGSFLSSTINLNTVGNGAGITVTGPGGHLVNVLPTLPSGGTVAPGTGGTGMVAPQLKGCLYHGQVYVMGQRWDDGCVKTCECVNEDNGLYQCRDRCPHYINQPAGCTALRPDPNDACCTVPHCQGYVPIPVYNQQTQSVGAVKPPSMKDLITGVFTIDYTLRFSGGLVDKPTTPSSQSTGGIGYCSYKNHHYQHAQQWQDGCAYNCVCENAATGSWRCVDRCKKFENIPKPWCWLIPDPQDSCCKVPFCDFTGNKTQFTGKASLPPFTFPPVTTQPPTTPSTTPKAAVCVYKSQSYSKGQMWYDGCSLKCTCDNPEQGFFRCTNRCPQYNDIPLKFCHWEQDPQDPKCCRIPKCDFTPTSGSMTGHGNPQTVPPGSFSGTGQNPGSSTKIGYCNYKNKQYSQSQAWQDGCQYNCKCDDADSGLYTCTDMCPRYAGLPPQCHFVTDFSNPCCKKPDCHFGYNSGQITGNGGILTPAPGTLPPGQTPPPLPTCVYGGVPYYQAQTWQDGCNLNCRCEDAKTGLYVCVDRCPKFGSLPSSCQMVTNPSDPCCQKPQCKFIPTAGQINGSAVPTIPPTLAPGRIVGQVPTPAPGPGGQIPTMTPVNMCTYKSITYKQGEKWTDGCEFDCECVDATIGKYICTERCPRFAAMPPQCHLIKDARNPCCQTPVCDFTSTSGQNTGHGNLTPNPAGTPTPGSGLNTPTPGPKPSFCVYKGVNYAQGQQWYDGCDYSCSCEDSLKGVYRCTNRCPSYPPMPSGCRLVSDPVDPLCCKRPECDFNATGGQQTGFLIPSVPPGTVTGGSVVPTPNPMLAPSLAPGVHPTPPYRDVCLYKGNEYSQGQKWQDGCDYNCVCEDARQGQYRCTEQCAKYANIPQQCHMVPDAMNPCCHKPYCDFSGVHGQHTGQGHLTPSPGPGIHPTPSPKPAILGCSLVTDPKDTCCKVPSCPLTIHNTPAPSLAPGMTPPVNPNVNPTPLPYPIPTAIPGVIHGSVVNPDHNKPNTTSMCEFHHILYHTGDTWKDGCQFNCVCEDEKTGKYKCTERCPAYMNIPPYCTMVVDLNDSCCKVPSCTAPHGLQTPLPGSTLSPPTNKPGVSPTPGANPIPTPQPQASCYYKNVRYVQGQQWYDGCDKVCVCEDGKTNFYRCSDRCTTYTNVPAQCRMVADPKDPQCCQVPDCTPTPGPNGYPTPKPGVSAVPTMFTNVPGFITGLAPTPTPGVNGKTPAPRHACVYQGTEYRQGQQWQDGCHYNCVCENEVTGKYRCAERCPTYPFVPPQCKLERDSKDICCFKMTCDFQKPTPNPYAVPTPGPNQSPRPNVQPTLGPGQTPNPNATPVPTKGPVIPPQLSYCVYKGVPYRQGQEWTEGCKQKCRCDDASNDVYNCFDRCPSYNNLPASCTMVADPADPCCQIPQCLKVPTPMPGITPAPKPGQKPTPVPSPLPTAVPGIINGHSPNHNPVDKLGSCVYKGIKYTHGQTWQDGCLLNCVCLDDSTGQYQCTERCPKYPNIPSYCFMVSDPNDACCQTPQCPGLVPTPRPAVTPSPGPHATPGQLGTTLLPPVLTTPKPLPKEMCLYKGHAYSEKQFWYDGCEKRCVCEDGKTGFYRCTDRCPQYLNIAPNCIMVVDPQDPVCCKVPQCNHGTNTAIPTGVVGVVTGQGLPPTGGPTPTPGPGVSTMFPPLLTLTPTPGPGVSPTPREVCVYKNREYKPGQKWVDGCDYTCECIDGTTGQYRCTDRCPHFPNLPYYCRMVFDPSNPCCQKPDCNQPTPKPGQNPTPQFCVYNGIPFRQGQSWNDGCDKVCRCEDAITGHINCDDRCPKFTSTPPGCSLVTDTKDQCCQVPSCKSANTNNPDTYLKGVYGTLSGSSLPPDKQNPMPKKAECVYHGRSYKQGDKWDDGCSYTCECLDDHTGAYKCKEMCPRYPMLPSQCTMVNDPQNKCCQTPSCPGVNPTPYPIGYTPYPGATPYPGPSKYPIGFTPSPGATPYLGPTPWPIGYVPYPGATPYPGPSKYPIGYTPSPGATPYLGPTPYPIGYVPYPGMTPYPGPSRYPIGFTPSPGATPYLGPTPWPIGYTPKPGATPYPGPSKYPIGFTPSPGATPYLGPTPWPIGYTPKPGATPYPGPSKYPIGFTPSPGATPYLGPTPYPIGYTPWPNATPYPGPSKYPIGFTPSPGATPYLGPTPWPIGHIPYPGATPYPGPSKYPIGFTPSPGATPYLGPTPWPIGFVPSSGATPYPGPSKYPIGFTPSPGATPYLGPTPWPIGHIPSPGATPYPGPSKYPIGFTPSPGATPYLGPTPWPIGYTPFPGATPYAGPKPQPKTPTPYPIGFTPYPGATPYPGPNKYPIGYTPSPGATPYLGPTPYPIGYVPYPGATPYPGPSKYPIGFTPSPGATPYLGPTPWPIGSIPYPGGTPYPGPSKYPIGFTPSPGATPYLGPTPWPIGYTPNPFATPYPGPSKYPIGFTPSPGATPYLGPTPYPIGYTPWPNATPYPGPSKYPMWFTPSPGATPYLGPTPYPIGYVPYPGATPYPGPNKYPIGFTPSPGATPYLGPTPWPIGYTPKPGATPYPGPSKYPIGFTPSPGATPYLGPTPWPIGHVPYPGATPYPGPSKYPIGFTPSPGATPYLGPTPWPVGYVPFPGATPYPGPSKYPIGFTPSPGATPYLGPTPWPIGYTPSPGATPYPGPSKYPIGYTPSPGATPYLGPTPWPIGFMPYPGATPYLGPHLQPQKTPTPAPDAKVCTYKNQNYRQDQQWYDGCNAICKCEDAVTGHYRCQERCAHFTNIPANCMMVPDPRDPSCCQMPECPFPTPKPGVTPTPGYISITPATGVITGIGKIPTPSPLLSPSPGPGQSPTKAPSKGCLYRGVVYAKGQTWTDGCDYDCECLDDMTGRYKCSEKCPRIPNLPKQCVLLLDPKNPCCKTPFCDFQHPTPFPGGIPTPDPHLLPSLGPGMGTTLVPGFQTPPSNKPNKNPLQNQGFCVYKGVYYRQGQTWSDGCKQICACDDSSTGQYTCKERCSTFPNLPPTCMLQTDPSDSCCLVPNCNNLPAHVITPKVPPAINSTGGPQTPGTVFGTHTGTPTAGTTPAPVLLPTGVPGSFQGSSGSGNHPLGMNSGGTSGFGGVCVYKSVAYKQNEKWTDGCNYKCECLDAVRGLYKCTDICSKYYFVPPQCRMVQDPHNTCCKVAECDPSIFTPTPNPFPVSPFTVTGPGGSPTPQAPITKFGTHTGTPPIHISPGGQTGPQGSGHPMTPVTNFGSHTGTPPLHISPGGQTGPHGSGHPMTPVTKFGSHTGTPLIHISPGGQTGPQGSGHPMTPVTKFGSHTGTPLIHISPGGQTGPQGSGHPMTPVTKFGSHTGTPPIHISPGGKTGPQGSGHPMTPVTKFGSHTGTPPLHISPGGLTGPQGSGHPMTPVTKFGSHTGTPVPTSAKPPNMCMYTDGKVYFQGQTWNDGCQYLCNCLDPKMNNYRCDLRCPSYSGLPSFCTMQPDPMDQCCKKPSCIYNGHVLQPLPGDKFHPPLNPTLSPGVKNIIPLGTHSVFSGSSYLPGSMSSGMAGGHTVCVYKNTVHKQGESWDDGCKYTCTCLPGQKGVYRCISKCPTYPAIPQYCKFTDVPGQCCPSMSCNIPDVGNYHPVPQINPHPVPTLAPGQIPTPGPTPDPQVIVGAGPGTNFGGANPGGGAPVPTIASTGGFVSGINDKCIYQGRMYNTGEKWSDGCRYDCQCKDGYSGFYECTPKCATFSQDQIPKQCYLVKSPGSCCAHPVCQKPDGSLVDPLLHPGAYPLVGSYSGGFTGFRPGYSPNYIPTLSGSIGGRLEGCVYKGVVHRKGERWTDGCKYDCECRDNQLGQYMCTPKCPMYTALPPMCKMVAPPSGQCCQQVSCQVSTVMPTTVRHNIPTGLCMDKLDNCKAYGKSSCVPPYVAWAQSNCPAFCGFCKVSVQTTPPPCVDKLPNCQLYGKTACIGLYKPWAGDNCRKFCDLCSGSTTPPPTTLAPVQCVDKLKNCNEYGSYTCSGQYTAWARDNCANFCGYCATTPPPVTAILGHGWTLLLKGVAGIPGNLASLWNSPTTLNEHVPLAQYLTNQYPGHYKPDLSNHWNECNFKQIKVAIFNKGVEKANIIFNAVGATKNNWFSPSRIISSTWNDIKMAPPGVFSIQGDPLSGREFYANSHSNGCSVLGWIMISSKQGCSWETTNGQGPSFFYAPGSNMVDFQQTQPGSGDVFAIMAQGGTCGSINTTPAPVTGFTGTTGGVCFYKNKLYKEGESWSDGCDFNCTCLIGQSGVYRCRDLCPTYTKLPQQCTLIKKPGECCSTPKCPGQNNNYNSCFYKGQNYAQGATWDDGCDFKCTCEDASKGFYQCRSKCVQWQLPKQCTMKAPPAGKCCPVPSCPPSIIITYPDNYVAE
ncbi:uncharacterized protein LOC121389362 [Gigantopelta aegis]|uniref:uncharacterized protein LOC121389362 n=1 Tax=Gigantopelta aegis TaxID=1735272 RepID=UPI001B88A3B0|nr:uncharacterized protein LOC121389362 [Gigantopelta aegis]